TGAAVRDIIRTVKRRSGLVDLIIAPAKVQGEGAAEEIARAIALLDSAKSSWGKLDVIIIGRGGGSLEDLWAFNEEIVAYAIFNSKIPVISGVGHESDFTIADYVADLRAPTPSVAMELATPDVEEIIAFLSDFFYNSTDSVTEKIEKKKEEVERIIYSYGFKQLPDMVNRKSQQTDNALSAIFSKIEKIFLLLDRNLSLISKTLDSYDIKKTLKKGFVLVQQNSKFVVRAANFNKLAAAKLRFSDGEVDVNSSGSGSKA
ncbi:MAG: exodeoxyribonuclease VII large subunit, partial [Ignavibacteriae bacterium]